MAASTSINTAYIILSGVVIIAAVAVFVVLRPLVQEVQTLRGEIQQNELVLQDKEEFLRTIDRKLAALQTQQDQEKRLQVVLPTEERIEDTLRVLHDAAARTGVTLKTVANDSASAQTVINSKKARGETVSIPSSVVPLLVNVKYVGTYQQIRAFITEVQKSPRLMDIQRLEMSGDSKQTDIIEGNMAVQFYMQQATSLNEVTQ